MLRVRYKSCIDREPLLNEVIQRSKHTERDLFILLTRLMFLENFVYLVKLLDEIAQIFYGVQRKNPMEGMFGDIFKV